MNKVAILLVLIVTVECINLNELSIMCKHNTKLPDIMQERYDAFSRYNESRLTYSIVIGGVFGTLLLAIIQEEQRLSITAIICGFIIGSVTLAMLVSCNQSFDYFMRQQPDKFKDFIEWGNYSVVGIFDKSLKLNGKTKVYIEDELVFDGIVFNCDFIE